MRRRLLHLTLATVMALGIVAGPAFAQGRGDGPIVYVTGQDRFYDSIVTVDPLPARGPFQELRMGPNGLETDVGPGDPGYVGGRWWMDVNGNGLQDADDHYFSCPLLGPGRPAP